MTSRLKTIFFNYKFVFLLFLSLHIIFFNINTAEWGDSYRILRASEFARKGAYPSDEKRPPLFSILLSIRPAAQDQIIWGRLFMFAVSVLFYFLFTKYARMYIKDNNYALLAVLYFIFNPIIFYWSLRIMADAFFAFLALLALYWLASWRDSLDFGKLFLLGFVSSLSVLTRFEGYLLFISVVVGIYFGTEKISLSSLRIKNLWRKLKNSILNILIYTITFIIVLSPYLISKDPLKSSYFKEPLSRSYDFTNVWVYLVSLLFIFGSLFSFFFIYKKPRPFISFFQRNISAAVFIVLELLLILWWPAAIPRLFTCTIPFLIIPLVLSIEAFVKKKENIRNKDLLILILLILIYSVSQYYLKLQFLIPVKISFIAIILLHILIIFLIKKGKYLLFNVLIVISLFFWTVQTVILHKDIYTAIKEAAEYSINNLEGVIASNDATYLYEWYLNYYSGNKEARSVYIGEKDIDGILKGGNIDYILVTNEDNISPRFSTSDRQDLYLIKDFRYNISGREFYARIYKIVEIK